jgi:pimeloyl-ACP methyl ester carboxylesterase
VYFGGQEWGHPSASLRGCCTHEELLLATDDLADLRWHRTTLDGLEVAYGDVGEGPPAVFVHGWGLSSRTYGDAITALARSGTRVIAPALPGFGRSAALPGQLTWERLAWWTKQLCDHAGVEEPAFFIGHSFGGAVSTATAWYHPELVRSLTLVNAVGGAVWKPGEGDDEDAHLGERPLWDWARHLPREFAGREYRRVFPVVARDFLSNALFNLPALRRAANLARTADLRQELTELAQRGLPVTILWGDQDAVVPEAAFAATCEALDVEGDQVQGAHHSWLLADPEGFGELMTNSMAVHAMVEDRAATKGPAT